MAGTLNISVILWGTNIHCRTTETVTGTTLNGKKEYLKAELGDKDKWDFLNFAEAWTPSETTLAAGGVFEKDKQHDIRSFFFSPDAAKEKKRKRTEGEVCLSPEKNYNSQDPPDLQDQDFSPQVKRLWLPTPSSTHSPRSRLGGKRRSLHGGRDTSSSPLASLFTPRRLSEKGTPKPRLSPRPGPPDQEEGDEWSCGACTYSNSILLLYCEMCESPLHRPSTGESQTDSVSSPADGVDTTASLPLYPNMKFCASKNTERIYLYSQVHDEASTLYSTLLLLLPLSPPRPPSPPRLKWCCDSLCVGQILRFVQQWSTLTAMKQRLIRRSGLLFCSPVLVLDQLTSTQRKHSSTKRYLTKEDVSQASLSKAQCDGGTVRMVHKEIPSEVHPEPPVGAPEGPSEAEAGYLQVLDSEGRPLCLSCHKACGSTGGAWDTCFCSQTCQEEFQLRSSQAYMRARVLQTEQGVCQSCGLQAHQLYLKVRDAPPTHRKEMLENTWLAQLSLKQLNEMIRAPVEGQFWQVDHIRPVYSGGGQCSLDNLQTLCTFCHRTRTAQQAKDRSQMKKGLAASKVASDITRFFIKK
uniref:RanBP2-type domain-containing protein n=1 Tax=Salmo trutta TaxID=8032 RepID=A0A674DQ70_SALTR